MVLVVAFVACGPLPPRYPGGTVTPIELTAERWLVRGAIDGRPVTLVLDTGASITSLTTAAARRLSLAPREVTTINGELPAGIATLDRLDLGGTRHERVRVAIVDMPHAADLGDRVDGIVGLDVLGQHDFVFDFVRGTLALYPPGALAQAPVPRGMTRVPFRRARHGVIELPATLDGYGPYPAVLDLGSEYNLLSVEAQMRRAAGGRTPTRGVRIGSADLPGRVFPVEPQMFVRLGYAGRAALVLGNVAFDRRVIAIAYRDQLAFISE